MKWSETDIIVISCGVGGDGGGGGELGLGDGAGFSTYFGKGLITVRAVGASVGCFDIYFGVAIYS